MRSFVHLMVLGVGLCLAMCLVPPATPQQVTRSGAAGATGATGATGPTGPAPAGSGLVGVASGTPFTDSFFTISNQGTGTESIAYYNSTGTTGNTLITIRDGAANSAPVFPPTMEFLTNAGTATVGINSRGIGLAGKPLYLDNVSPASGLERIQNNSVGSVDLYSNMTTGSAQDSSKFWNGMVNIVGATGTSDTTGYGSLSATSGMQTAVSIFPGFKPTSGTAAFATWNDQVVINQTGGANGITRGIYENPTLTAAADYRAIEVADVGSTQTAIKTGTGKIILGNLTVTGAATGKTIVCVDTTTGQLYASTSGVACAN